MKENVKIFTIVPGPEGIAKGKIRSRKICTWLVALSRAKVQLQLLESPDFGSSVLLSQVKRCADLLSPNSQVACLLLTLA